MRWIEIGKYQRGLLFRDGAFERVLGPGLHLTFGSRTRTRIDVVSLREPWFEHEELNLVLRSGALTGALRTIELTEHQRALVWIDGKLERMLGPGRHAVWNVLHEVGVDVVSVRDLRLNVADPEAVIRSGVLGEEAEVVELGDHEKALVRVDGRIAALLGAGLHAVWRVGREVAVERFAAQPVVFEHGELPAILKAANADQHLASTRVDVGSVGLVYHEGELVARAAAGLHAFWLGEGQVRTVHVDLREQSTDVGGQEIMTADKVTLRLNAVVTWKVAEAETAVTAVEDYRQALYREAQLALRAAVGTRELDDLLADKEALASEVEAQVAGRATAFGLQVTGFGVRDVILPGEMRELLNRVTEARKAAEASLVTRREETAAMRSQANTARIFESNPMLMRLRELEVLEKVADNANLTVVLGEGGLADRVVKLL